MGHLAGCEQELADDIIAIRDAGRKSTGFTGNCFQQGAVCTVTHDEGKQAYIFFPDQLQEFFLCSLTNIGNTIGYQYDTGGAVSIQRVETLFESRV